MGWQGGGVGVGRVRRAPTRDRPYGGLGLRKAPGGFETRPYGGWWSFGGEIFRGDREDMWEGYSCRVLWYLR